MAVAGTVLCRVFYLGRIDHHLVHDAFLPDSGEEADMFSVFFRRILFQLYHTVRKRRPADAALLYEKGENISSGINGDSDDRHDHLQSGAGRGGTWACSVRTGLPAPVSDGILPVFYLGIGLNVFCVTAMLILVFHPALARTILVLGLKIVEKLHLMKRKESRLKKLEASMEVYQNTAAYLGTHKMVLVNVLAITFAQRFALFAATWFVYRAFHLSGISFITIVLLQAVISVSVDMLPLPGGMGISETLFLKIFPPVFGSTLLLPAMVLSRGLGYYGELLVSAVFTIVAQLTIGNTKREKRGGTTYDRVL